MAPVATVVGTQTEIELFFGTEACPPDAPLVCASELGYGPLGSATSGQSSRAAIEQLANWMRETDEGAYVALIDAPPAPRRLGLVQDDRSSGTARNFYESHRPDGRIWRDFYYATTYVLFEQLDARWAAGDVELSHPTGFDWPPELLPTVLDALGQLADSRELALQRVHLSCHHHLTEADVVQAMATLNREQREHDHPTHRDLHVAQLSAETVLRGAPDGAVIYHAHIAE